MALSLIVGNGIGVGNSETHSAGGQERQEPSDAANHAAPSGLSGRTLGHAPRGAKFVGTAAVIKAPRLPRPPPAHPPVPVLSGRFTPQELTVPQNALTPGDAQSRLQTRPANTAPRGIDVDSSGQSTIDLNGQRQPVRYDSANSTWRTYVDGNPTKPGVPVRVDVDGRWQTHSDVGLPGGMDRINASTASARTVQIGNETRTVQLNTGSLTIPSGMTPGDFDLGAATELSRSSSGTHLVSQTMLAGPQRGWCAGCVFEAFGRKADGRAPSLAVAVRQMHDEHRAGGRTRQTLQSSIAVKQAMGGWYDLSREPGNYVRYPGHSIAARHGGSLIEDLRQGLSFPADPHAPEPDAHGAQLARDPENQRSFVLVALDSRRPQMTRMGPPGHETTVPSRGHAIGVERSFTSLNYRTDTYTIYDPNAGVFTYQNFDQMAYALQRYYDSSGARNGGNEYVHWTTSYYGKKPSTAPGEDDALLDRTIAAWRDRVTLSDAQRIDNLTRQSNAGRFASLRPFIEDGDLHINDVLRANGYRSPDVQRFLEDFGRLRDYRGESYRVVMLPPHALDALLSGQQTPFFDDGVQSASVALPHARIWFNRLPRNGAGVKPVIMVFDRTVPQKNISYGNGSGMVAVEPGVPLALQRVVKDGDVTFAVFSAARHSDGPMTRLGDGEVVNHSRV